MISFKGERYRLANDQAHCISNINDLC
jgi:hypothetical protein